MTLEQLLLELGLGITSNFIYGVIKNYIANKSNPTIEGLKETLISYIKIDSANVKADKIIQFLAENGDIIISDTHIYASKSIIMESNQNTKFDFGNNSSSKTNKSSIEAGNNCHIIGTGGARIEQDKEGNIKFFA